MKHLLFFALLAASLSVCAQPPHAGVLLNAQFEGAGSGNGQIVGVEAQHVAAWRLGFHPFKLATNASFTMDEKVYRHQFGGALRLTSLVRYYEPRERFLFLQGGVNLGGIAFPDTKPGANDGYAKYLLRPVAGGGIDVVRDDYGIVVDYQFHFKRKIYAQAPRVNDFRNRFVDGWTAGQRVGLQSTFVLYKSKWLFLLNAAAGRYGYQRNPALYGSQLGSVVHRFNAYEVSVGLGRKLGD